MTTLQKLNEMCSSSNVSLIAGYSGMGISELALSIISEPSDPNTTDKVLYISFRDFQEVIATHFESINEARNDLNVELKIISNVYPSSISIIKRVLDYHAGGYSQFIIDDLIQVEGSEIELEEMISSLGQLSMHLGVRLMFLYTLGESITIRGGEKRPLPEDLNPRHYLKSVPDLILFLNRPEFWGIIEDENGRSLLNKAEVIVAKGTTGLNEIMKLKFDPHSRLFS